ncbi:hypothetical protein ABZ260_33875 [Streptosporangium sp. NPDC006013]|uniref:hypothetical protein n=1 Tax=Streptosporangium sp. NPDC006013 TaxID=3155596 RepID=UPI0033A00D34
MGGGETLTKIWHAPDCATHLEWQQRMQAGAEKARQEEEWAAVAFPAGYARLQKALGELPAEQRGTPFVAALAELAELQATRRASGGGFVILPEWAEIFDRHFLPVQP